MANRCSFTWQPGGIVAILLLVLLLAFRTHACPMPFDAAPSLSSTHDCHHDTAAIADVLTIPLRSPCHDGACAQAFSRQGEVDLHHLPAAGLDRLALNITSGWLPPDWSNRPDLLPSFTIAVGLSPLQRSRVLRL
ncbi:MAG: hypothetical protein H6975_07685 [Gammaproteobacteria bacterium]|nr:hypothetical protein [Gammaproteobacteria bacterium]